MIKLITCDIDGTLIPHVSMELDPIYFDLIRRLREKGYAFAAASGRQFFRLRQMFAPVADEIFFICENGAVVSDGGRLLSTTALDRQKADELAALILENDELELLISGPESCYIIPKTDDYVRLVREELGYLTTIVSSLDEIKEPIVKVTAYRKAGAAAVAPQFEEWGHVFNMAIAGPEWLDFTLSDKGTGLDVICNETGISPDEVMSFGDNFNDVPLIDKVGMPFIMSGACDQLLARYSRHCDLVSAQLEAFLQNSDRK